MSDYYIKKYIKKSKHEDDCCKHKEHCWRKHKKRCCCKHKKWKKIRININIYNHAETGGQISGNAGQNANQGGQIAKNGGQNANQKGIVVRKCRKKNKKI